MANYVMYILPQSTDGETVLVYMTDNWYDPKNYWSVKTNSWFGVHKGTYLYDSGNLNFFGDAEEEQIMQFVGIDYPHDCANPDNLTDTSGGNGTIESTFRPGMLQNIKWFRYSSPPWGGGLPRP